MHRLLRRDVRNSFLGGVAAGFAEYFDIDPVMARLGFVLLALLDGLGLALYVACWILVPRKDVDKSADTPVERVVTGLREGGEKIAAGLRHDGHANGRGRVIAGAAMIGLGGVLLLDRIGWWYWPYWARPANLWPLILIAIGIALLVESLKPKGAAG